MSWDHVCILCANRDKATKLESGHCCVPCGVWLARQVSEILRLSCEAASSIPKGSSTGGGSGSFGPREPLNLAALDPELALIELNEGDSSSAVPILDMLEAWERSIREDRGMVPYGPASAARNAATGSVHTSATLTGCTGFLFAHMDWITTEPTFALEEFADHMRRAVRILKRWDMDTEDIGTMVKCPTLFDDGECGYRLYYREADEHVTCRRCGASRDVTTLVAVAMSDGRPVWLDPEAASKWLGVSESTLQRMARRGDMERSHGRYLIRHAEVSA